MVKGWIYRILDEMNGWLRLKDQDLGLMMDERNKGIKNSF